MAALARMREGVYLRIVDIGSWDSAVAEQFGIRTLPTVWIYEDGKVVAKDRAAVMAKLNSL